MSTEKAQAIVIRQADFSESSRVITLFSKEFGKFGVLAKGAKRLKGPFDAALDLLSKCRVIFIAKSSGALGILTQAHLEKNFEPVPKSLNSLYGGYYVAELLNGLTEDRDPDPNVFDTAVATLEALEDPSADCLTTLVSFEIQLLHLIGLFPDLTQCCICSEPVEAGERFVHWVRQGGLLCKGCRNQEYESRSVSAGTVAVLRRLADQKSVLSNRLKINDNQCRECHALAVSVISSALGRKPEMLRYLSWKK